MNLNKNKKRYVVSKYPNAGMGDHISCLVGAWWYAKNTGRELVIDWRGSRYNNDKPNNCFNRFFYICNSLDVTLIHDDTVGSINFESSFYHSKWNIESVRALDHQPHTKKEIATVNRLVDSCEERDENTIIFNQHIDTVPWFNPQVEKFANSLNVSDQINDKVEKFQKKKFNEAKVLGLHIRNGNGENIFNRAAYWIGGITLIRQLKLNRNFDILSLKKTEGNKRGYGANNEVLTANSLIPTKGKQTLTETLLYRSIKRYYNDFKQKYKNHETCIFVCTDSERVVKNLKKLIPEVVVYPKKMLNEGTGPLHQLSGSIEDGTDIALQDSSNEDMLVEMELLRRCHGLVCIPSQFSLLARSAIDKNDVVLLKPNLINRIILKFMIS